MKTNQKERGKNTDQDQEVEKDPTQENTSTKGPEAERGPEKEKDQGPGIVARIPDLKIVKGLILEIAKGLKIEKGQSQGSTKDQEIVLRHVTEDTGESIADREVDRKEGDDRGSEKDVQGLHREVIMNSVIIEPWMNKKDSLEDWKELKNSLKSKTNSVKTQKDLTSIWQHMRLRQKRSRWR